MRGDDRLNSLAAVDVVRPVVDALLELNSVGVMRGREA